MSRIFRLAFFLLLSSGFSNAIQVWQGIYLKGAKVGYSFWQANKTQKGYDIVEKTTIDLNMLGLRKHLTTFTRVKTDKTLKIKNFSFELISEDQHLKFSGKIVDHKIVLTQRGHGVPESKDFTGELTLAPVLPLLLQNRKNFRVSLFDPSTFTVDEAKIQYAGTEEIEIEGKKVKAKKFEMEYLGARSVIYYANGVILKEISPMNMVIVKESKEKATKIGNKRVDILSMFSIVPEGLKEDPANYSVLKIKLIGLPDPKNVKLNLNFAGQKLLERKDGIAIIEIFKQKIPQPANIQNIPDSLEKYLEPTPSMQVDAPEIQKLADDITRGVVDPVEKARRILLYVYSHLQKKPSVTLPTALDVLHNGYGDCNEHSVLFGALARAAGIPTVITVGLIYGGNAYYYHAWNAVYLGGKWIFVDPVTGEFPASTGHILLKIGELGEQSKLLPVIGNLRIKVLEAK